MLSKKIIRELSWSDIPEKITIKKKGSKKKVKESTSSEKAKKKSSKSLEKFNKKPSKKNGEELLSSPIIKIKYKSKIDKKEQKEIIQWIEGKCPSSDIPKKWTPIKIIGQGKQSLAIQICNYESCNYIIKIGSKWEAEFATKMCKIGLSPLIYETFICGDKVGIIMKKMDGDLSTFLYPPIRMDEIMPQVLDLIYKVVVDHNICHKDPKVNNFLWKEVKGKLRIYITDFGIAKECKDSDDTYQILKLSLSIFNKTFISPIESGVSSPKGITHLLKDSNNIKYKKWVYTFIKAEYDALAKDKRWKEIYKNFTEVGYSYYLKK